MKKSISVRILTALGGLTLLALGVGLAAESFFGVQVTAAAGKLLASGHVLAVLGKLVLIIALAVLAVAAVICALPRRNKEQRDYVMQRGENGAIGISVRAIEKQVRSCVAKHDVIADAEISIRECRDGLIILLNVDQVAGVNIPLSVGLLQKQIKQYVSSCTGVDVHEVRVMVENNTDNVVASAFAVQDAMIPQVRPAEEQQAPAEPVETTPAAPVAAEAPAETPAAAPAPVPAVVLPEIPPVPAVPELPEEDERPLHQRIFGAEEQPVFVPAPPEMLEEPQVEVEEEAAEEPEATPVEDVEQAAETELVIDVGDDAAEAGAAYSEALWTDDDVAAAVDAVVEFCDDTAENAAAEEDEEEPQALL